MHPIQHITALQHFIPHVINTQSRVMTIMNFIYYDISRYEINHEDRRHSSIYETNSNNHTGNSHYITLKVSPWRSPYSDLPKRTRYLA